MKNILSAWYIKAVFIMGILILVLLVLIPIIVKPYSVSVIYGEEEISFMPYTIRMWNIKIGSSSLTLSAPARQDPVNVIFKGVSPGEIEQVFEGMCWDKQRPFIVSQISKYQIFKGWRLHSPVLEFAVEEKLNPYQRLHIRIFDNGEKDGTSWLLGAIHQEYYDKMEDTHIIVSYEAAEELLTQAILEKTSAKIGTSVLINEIFWQGKESDGRATIIDFSGVNLTGNNRPTQNCE